MSFVVFYRNIIGCMRVAVCLRLSCCGGGKDAVNMDIVDSFLTLETTPVYMKFEFVSFCLFDC